MTDDELNDMLADFEALRKQFLAFAERWPQWGRMNPQAFTEDHIQRLDNAADSFTLTIEECLT